jgi:hypothetical protein
MIKHIKNLLELKIKEITELNVEVCQNDVNIENFKDSDFVVSFEIHEGRRKSTNDFSIAIFINSYAKDPDSAIVLAKLVYDKVEKLKLENEWVKTTQFLYVNSLSDTMYYEDLKLYYQISNYKSSYRRLK